MRTRDLAILLVALIGATGCTSGPSVDATGGPLHGSWSLTSGTAPDGEVPLSADVDVILTIEPGEWTGAICNTYGAEVEVTEDGQVSVRGDGIRRTEMACLDPQVMDAEVTYLDALPLVTSWRVEEDVLTLEGDDVSLTFGRQPTTPDAEPTGTV